MGLTTEGRPRHSNTSSISQENQSKIDTLKYVLYCDTNLYGYVFMNNIVVELLDMICKVMSSL